MFNCWRYILKLLKIWCSRHNRKNLLHKWFTKRFAKTLEQVHPPNTSFKFLHIFCCISSEWYLLAQELFKVLPKSWLLYSQYQSPRFCWGDGFQSQILETGYQKKMSAWVDLKSSCHEYLPGGRGLTMFLVKKRLLKIKFGFEWSISNVDLGLFWPNNQLMFSYVTLWFC